MSVYFSVKKITQNDFSVRFFNFQPMSFQYTRVNRLFQCVFDHVWYVLLPERDDTIFVYRAPFFCQ